MQQAQKRLISAQRQERQQSNVAGLTLVIGSCAANTMQNALKFRYLQRVCA
ncbi:unnamed protein product [Ectocarpus sp. CCAP 1310/34]|nr:unnamed protein product [Ectocarpus sp. CCAP 1310/34]